MTHKGAEICDLPAGTLSVGASGDVCILILIKSGRLMLKPSKANQEIVHGMGGRFEVRSRRLLSAVKKSSD